MSAIPETLAQLRVPIASVRPYPGNAKRHDLDTLRASLRRHRQYRPIVVQESTGFVLAGNGTLAAATAEGWTEIAATFIDCDDDAARRINLIDNRAPELGGFDEAALAELLDSLPDLEGTGYTPDDLDELLASSAAMTPGKDTEPRPKPPEPNTELGDIYVLGDHRLVCGDATDLEALDRLLEGARFDLLYTDPPYGMSYQSFSRKFEVIQGDDLRGDELMALVHDSLALAGQHRAPGAASYVWCTWRTYPEFLQALARAGVEPTGCIVWKKGRVGPGSAHYRPEHEFCLYCRPDEDNDHGLCIYCKGDTWEGGRGQSDVWEVARDTGYVHPTQKPVALAEKALTNSTRPGGLALDLFGGSGSTMLACENLNRRARLVELDPGYCDVIVDRWQRHTGQQAEVQRASD